MDQWLKMVPDSVVNLPEGLRNLLFQLYQTFIAADRWKWFLNGLKITFAVTIGALILGVIIGLLIAIVRTAHDSRRMGKSNIILSILNAICKLYLTVIRGTPMMVQLLIMGFVIMVPKDDTARLVCGIVTLGINSGAYVAEIVRGGLMSVNPGQMEAGRSLGLNYAQTMRLIVIPQAIKNILPALGNEMITLLKDTSLVSVIALRDVTKQAQNIVSNTYQAYVPYVSLAIIYLVLVIILTKLLEENYRRGVMLKKGVFGMLGSIFTSPISLILFLLIVFMFTTQTQTYKRWKAKREAAKAAKAK